MTSTAQRGATQRKAVDRRTLAIHVLCAFVAIVTTIAVRLPSAYLWGASVGERETYTSEQGVPYLTDQDSYYHVRLVQNHLATGSLGNAVGEDGRPWDTHSYWPEGRSADYTPGIVWLTEAVWGVSRLFGASLEAVEFCMPAIIAAMASLVAYCLGARMSGPVGGLAAGVLVSCAPGFVQRSIFGRYDTDGLAILMDVLLALVLTEALRARKARSRVALCVGFALVALAYTLCWAPRYAMLFVGVTLLGGLAAALARLAVLAFAARGHKQGQMPRGCPELWAVLLCGALSAVGVLVAFGPGFFAQIAGAVQRTTAVTTSGTLPNLFASISELRIPDLVPSEVANWFVTSGSRMTVLEGAGGVSVALLSVTALVVLLVGGFFKVGSWRGALPGRRACRAYLFVLGAVFVGALYASMKGVRFVEHLSVPAGVLAGATVGWGARRIMSWDRAHVVVGVLCSMVLCVSAVMPVLLGAQTVSRGSRPSSTDASAHGMQWIRQNAEDPDAAIASWWDMGYFYESESGHPCIWDGGSQNGARAIMVGRVLTATDPELSIRTLRMLCTTGNAAIDMLMEHADAPVAFEALWDALPLDKEEACTVLEDCCDLTPEEAEQAEALMHPVNAPEEAYLVITDSMLRRLGWYEYYADWDFTGTTPTPASTGYDRTPDGYALRGTSEGKELLKRRSAETMWRLMLDKEDVDGFERVFDEDDGEETVCIWRVSLAGDGE
ncbi:MAG: hypothetical protein IKG22_13930 [Atopobiaceae bacterium]|nr:hypothetical protein [Atopobiaceae bacterium]